MSSHKNQELAVATVILAVLKSSQKRLCLSSMRVRNYGHSRSQNPDHIIHNKIILCPFLRIGNAITTHIILSVVYVVLRARQSVCAITVTAATCSDVG